MKKAISVKARVFAAGMGDGLALGWVRVVDQAGLPLGGVTVRERGPTGTTDLAVEPEVGAATLGGTPGRSTGRFSCPASGFHRGQSRSICTVIRRPRCGSPARAGQVR